MKPRYNEFNPKRRLLQPSAEQLTRLRALVNAVSYGGNPEHKKNPGDFGLTPPADPRRGKSLCDVVQIFSRTVALDALKEGLRRGLVSDRMVGAWPKNIWAVANDGTPLEAQLENPDIGSYHGYPMPDSDPLASEVVKRWGQANG